MELFDSQVLRVDGLTLVTQCDINQSPTRQPPTPRCAQQGRILRPPFEPNQILSRVVTANLGANIVVTTSQLSQQTRRTEEVLVTTAAVDEIIAGTITQVQQTRRTEEVTATTAAVDEIIAGTVTQVQQTRRTEEVTATTAAVDEIIAGTVTQVQQTRRMEEITATTAAVDEIIAGTVTQVQQTRSIEVVIPNTAAAGNNDGLPVGIAVGSAIGGIVGLGVAVVLLLLVLWFWRRSKKRQEAKKLATSPPPRYPPPRNLPRPSVENIAMVALGAPVPLPYERVTNRYIGVPGDIKQASKIEPLPGESKIEQSLDNALTLDLPNIYSRPKFYMQDANRVRGFSTSTHTYGDLGFGLSVDISTARTSKDWAKSRKVEEVSERDLDEEEVEEEVEEGEGEDDEEEEDLDDEEEEEEEEEEEDEEEDDDIDELYARISHGLIKSKNPETGQSKLYVNSGSHHYANTESQELEEDVIYINTSRNRNGELTPHVPTRRKKAEKKASTAGTASQLVPPRIKTRKGKRNRRTPAHSKDDGRYMAIIHETMNHASVYSSRSSTIGEQSAEDNLEV